MAHLTSLTQVVTWVCAICETCVLEFLVQGLMLALAGFLTLAPTHGQLHH